MNKESNLNKKLFSLRSIIITTYLLSPIVSGFMIRENFKNLGEKDKGNWALFIAFLIFFSFLVFLILIPENIVDKIPNPLFPLIYTGFIYYYLEKTQGEYLKLHEENNGEFYSIWKFNLISFIAIATIVFIAFIAGDFMKVETNYNAELYNEKVEQFVENENKSLQIINNFDSYNESDLSSKIRENGFFWQKNIKIINSIKEIENIPDEYIVQADLLLEYCSLRIKENEQLRIWSIDKINFNQTEMNETYKEIEQILEKLQ